ncbi:hypothetical protein JOC78_001982 [Bacillus ectoiniformans]|uniref:DUF2536 family protein n=1 Tax=Bacillus ectoiniformans TaxID=1494429 RepID=UPI00195D3C2E|nr:DUF2536 family protein [Bacillus ectoiniformans]MBM7649032.1 hypothetical protein [Bacillus ectoiniformans]
MSFQLELIEDKIEFFEALDLVTLEKKIQEKMEQNRALMLEVHSVSHQVQFDPNGHKHYSAVVHFKVKKL